MSPVPGTNPVAWESFGRVILQYGFQKILSREYQFCSLRQLYVIAAHREKHLVLYANSEPMSGGMHLGHGCIYGAVRITGNHLEAMGYLSEATDSYFIHADDIAHVCFGLPGYAGNPFERLDVLGQRYPFVPWNQPDMKLRLLDNLDIRLLKENDTYVTVDGINIYEQRWSEFLDAAPMWVHSMIFGEAPFQVARILRKRPI